MAAKEIIASGSWIYDNAAERPVFIVRTDYDYWYELGKADGQLEEGEVPVMGPDGFLYYVSFRGIGMDGSFSPDTSGFRSVDEAKEAAALKVPSVITWSDGV